MTFTTLIFIKLTNAHWHHVNIALSNFTKISQEISKVHVEINLPTLSKE
jgi:hypothetical protein